MKDIQSIPILSQNELKNFKNLITLRLQTLIQTQNDQFKSYINHISKPKFESS